MLPILYPTHTNLKLNKKTKTNDLLYKMIVEFKIDRNYKTYTCKAHTDFLLFQMGTFEKERGRDDDAGLDRK